MISTHKNQENFQRQLDSDIKELAKFKIRFLTRRQLDYLRCRNGKYAVKPVPSAFTVKTCSRQELAKILRRCPLSPHFGKTPSQLKIGPMQYN